MTGHFNLSALTAVVFLGGCATLPSGPSVMVLPGTGKTLEQFRGDDAACRQFANEQVSGVTPTQAANESVQKSAVVGTVVGAAAGAALGGDHGAAIGAGSGLLIGAAAGSSAGRMSASAVQQRYNNAYVQCMYTKGNRVPVSGQLIGIPSPGPHPPPPPASYPPPPPDFYPLPPPGSSPPPPPG